MMYCQVPNCRQRPTTVIRSDKGFAKLQVCSHHKEVLAKEQNNLQYKEEQEYEGNDMEPDTGSHPTIPNIG